MEELYLMSEFGTTSEEICEALARLPKIPFTEKDITLIKSNQSLSWVQKRKLIKKIKNDNGLIN